MFRYEVRTQNQSYQVLHLHTLIGEKGAVEVTLIESLKKGYVTAMGYHFYSKEPFEGYQFTHRVAWWEGKSYWGHQDRSIDEAFQQWKEQGEPVGYWEDHLKDIYHSFF